MAQHLQAEVKGDHRMRYVLSGKHTGQRRGTERGLNGRLGELPPGLDPCGNLRSEAGRGRRSGDHFDQYLDVARTEVVLEDALGGFHKLSGTRDLGNLGPVDLKSLITHSVERSQEEVGDRPEVVEDEALV